MVKAKRVRRNDEMTRDELVSWFWSRLDRSAGSCWTWPGARTKAGYGLLSWEKRKTYAHRLALVLSTGEAPEGMHVLHSCDNPPCCNPAHLRWGTQRDNARDSVERGRARRATGDASGARLHPETRARGERHGSRTKPEAVLRGEKTGKAKLREAHIPWIFEAYREGKSAPKIAKALGVGHAAILCVLHGQTWCHAAPDEPRIPVRVRGAQ
jgi:hypothetical protein